MPSNLTPTVVKQRVTRERLKEVLQYDWRTGVFTRLKAHGGKGGSKPVGSVAGSIGGGGYVYIAIDGVDYGAHRLAWFYVYGAWPPRELDHRDTNKANNRLSNLRLATRSQNGANRPLNVDNTSGFKGVSWEKRRSKFRAYITIDQKRKCLGYHSTAEAAAAAYAAAAVKYYGDFARAA